MDIVVYQTETGRIRASMTVPNEELADLQLRDGESWSLGRANRNTEYLSNGALVSRPISATVSGGSAPYVISLEGRPDGTVIHARDNTGRQVSIPVENDPQDPIRLTTPGTYTVDVIEPFPAQPNTDQVVEITGA